MHNQVKEIRDKYDWNINSGILFNHESEFRNNNYLIMKIIDKAIRIKNGEKSPIPLEELFEVQEKLLELIDKQ